MTVGNPVLEGLSINDERRRATTTSRGFSSSSSSSVPKQIPVSLAYSQSPRLPKRSSPLTISHEVRWLAPSTALLSASGPHRAILHIPFLGILTPKVLAALALKKTVVLAIIQKYGIKGTFDLLRETNEQLAKQLGPGAYPPTAKSAVKAGLDALELSVSKLDKNEQAEMLWNWLKNVDPSLAVETFKRYVNLSPQPSPTDSREERIQTEEEIQAIRAIAEQFPDISRKYNIVLIEKEPTPEPNFASGQKNQSKN